MNILIQKVYSNKISSQKLITIPKDSEIKEGDYVLIKKVEEKDNE